MVISAMLIGTMSTSGLSFVIDSDAASAGALREAVMTLMALTKYCRVVKSCSFGPRAAPPGSLGLVGPYC